MSNKRERERRREQRLEEESQSQGQERRKRLLQLGGLAAFLAVAVVVVLIAVSQNQGSGSGGDTNLEEVGAVKSLLQGVPQHGTVLGEPKAKVTLIEFGDLQCPICKAYSEEVVPQVISGPVSAGEAKIEFRNFTIISQQSVPAGAAAIAAGEQGRGWNFIELFYRNQGEEGSGYVTGSFLTSIAKGAGVPDIARWNADRKSKKVLAEVARTTREASNRFEFNGTPSFVAQGPGGSEKLGTPGSAEALEAGIRNVAGR